MIAGFVGALFAILGTLLLGWTLLHKKLARPDVVLQIVHGYMATAPFEKRAELVRFFGSWCGECGRKWSEHESDDPHLALDPLRTPLKFRSPKDPS